MPEGFNSIADLVLTIESSTEGLESGLKAARNLVQSFGAESGTALGGFQALINTAANGAGNLSARFNVASAALGAIRGTVAEVRDELAKFAEATGTQNEFRDLEAAAGDLEVAVAEGLSIALQLVAAQAQETGRAMVGLKADATETSDGTTELARRLQVDLAEGMRDAASKLRELGPDSAKSLDQLSRELARAQAHLESLREAASGSGNEVGAGWISTLLMSTKDLEQAVVGIDPKALQEAQARVADRSATLDSARAGQTRREEAIQFGLGISAEEERRAASVAAVEGLDVEVQSYERKISALGRTAAEAARAAAVEKVLAELNRQGIEDSAPIADMLAERADRIAKLAGDYDKLVKAQREADREKARGEAMKRADENIGLAFERDIGSIRAQKRALSETAEEADRLAYIEKEMASRRAAGLPIDARVMANIEGRARLYANENAELRELRETTASFRSVVDVFGRAAEGAFGEFIRGADMGGDAFKKMAASILEDLAMMTLRKTVIDPLSGALTSGLQSMFGDIAGARADGGPVEAGQTYLVGERGPELFMPSTGGTIIPNGAALGAANAAPIHISTQIDARGASQDAIAGIRQALAERDASLQGRVVQAVREAKSRGLV